MQCLLQRWWLWKMAVSWKRQWQSWTTPSWRTMMWACPSVPVTSSCVWPTCHPATLMTSFVNWLLSMGKSYFVSSWDQKQQVIMWTCVWLSVCVFSCLVYNLRRWKEQMQSELRNTSLALVSLSADITRFNRLTVSFPFLVCLGRWTLLLAW